MPSTVNFTIVEAMNTLSANALMHSILGEPLLTQSAHLLYLICSNPELTFERVEWIFSAGSGARVSLCLSVSPTHPATPSIAKSFAVCYLQVHTWPLGLRSMASDKVKVHSVHKGSPPNSQLTATQPSLCERAVVAISQLVINFAIVNTLKTLLTAQMTTQNTDVGHTILKVAAKDWAENQVKFWNRFN